MAGRVDVEWRKGPNGTLGTYSFFPRPSIQRPVSGHKLVEFKVPLMTGSITQLLGLDSRTLTLRGVVVAQDGPFDTLDTLRRNLINGLDVSQEGQLHIISNQGNPDSKHIFYKGIVARIDFDPLTNPRILDYTIEILLSDPTENIV